MTAPVFSICIPTRNRGHLIGKALESCLAQTYPSIEVVVVDNASSDNTAEVVSAYVRGDKRIRYFRNDRNIGVIRNILKAFQLSTGDYVQYLADDNWLADNYAEEKIKCFYLHPEVGLVASKFEKYQVSDHGIEGLLTSEISEGKIDAERAFLDFCKTAGWFGLLCTARRVDMISAIDRLGEIPNPHGYDYLNSDMFYDVLLFVVILASYPAMYFTEKTTYFDKITPSEMADPTKSNLVRWHHMNRVATEYAFSICGREKYITVYRGIFGAMLLLDLLDRMVLGPRKGLGLQTLPQFYGDYKGKDWLASARELMPFLTSRVSRRVRRLFSSKVFLEERGRS